MRKWIWIVGALGAGALGACGTSSAGDPSLPPLEDAGPQKPATDASTTKPDASSADVDAGKDAEPVVQTYTVSGTVTGLLGTGLVLQNNGGDDVTIASDGSFSFPTKLSSGDAFSVAIKTQPSAPLQSCTVSGGTGTIASGNITSVVVNCATDTFTVGGNVTGLVGSGLTLQNNGADDTVVNANGSFSFATPISSGATYAVTVATQPSSPSQTCTVTSDTGTVTSSNVTTVSVNCTTNQYRVGGTVSGLAGSGLTLQVNGGQSLSVAADGSFQFPDALPSGSAYEVTISAQPGSPAQTCTVAGGTGTIGGADVSSVAVNCATNKYTISGTASGVVGGGLVLQNNAGDDLPVSADGTFAFATPLDSGAAYSVSIKSQPTNPWQTCALSNATGTVGAAPISDVTLVCTTNKYLVKGAIVGLAGTGLVVQNNAGDDLSIAADGTFQFATSIASGATYNVTVKNQPSGLSQTCTVTNGTGAIGNADVEDVAISCTTNQYTVSANVTGLVGSGLVLRNNGGDDLPVGADGTFTFATSVLSGGNYTVTIASQPTGPSQTCTVSAGSGTVTNGNVVSVAVNCATNSFTVGGSVSGLVGTGLVLQNNAGGDLTVNNNGNFAFGASVLSGGGYAVTVKTQPSNPSQTCAVTNGSGTVGNGNVQDIIVSCTTNKYLIRGTVSGLSGTGLVLQNNGGDNKSITANGSFAFDTSISSGAAYAVTILSQPSGGQTCVVASGSGTVGSSDVTSVAVKCSTKTYVLNLDSAGAPVGWYRQDGTHDSTNYNYVVGQQSGNFWRDYFVFSLASIPSTETVVSVKLTAVNPTNGGAGPNGVAWVAHAYPSDTASINTLEATQSGAAGVAIYNQIAGGTTMGSQNLANVSDTSQSMSFNSYGVARTQSLLGQKMAIGTTYDSSGYVFGYSLAGPGSNLVQLTIQTAP